MVKVTDFIGDKATYDEMGQIIFGEKDNQMQRIADVRGWGAIQNLFKNNNGTINEKEAMAFQDKLGVWLTEAINEKLEREKNK